MQNNMAFDTCFEQDPEFVEVEEGHSCACHLVKPYQRPESRIKLETAREQPEDQFREAL